MTTFNPLVKKSGMGFGLLRLAALSAFLIVLTHLDSVAQEAELKAQTTALVNAVVDVQSGSKNYEQKIAFEEPALIRYTVDETDQKGNRTHHVYEFNLADMDPYAVREETQKDIISVVAAARNKQKLVKVYKNEEVQSYEAQASIIAKDIDNARAIADIIKKSAPVADKVMASRLNLSGFDDMVSWLVANVKDVNLGAKTINNP